jgi:GNAT superfamily N-acetyltransferase
MDSATALDPTPAPLAAAVEANMVAFMATLAPLPQVEFHEDTDSVRFISGIPHPLLNAVMRARFAPDEADTRIDATLRHFTSRGLPLCWYAGPTSQPADLGARLEAHGLTHAEDMPGMAVDLLALSEEPAGQPDLQIEQVGDLPMLEEWLRPLAIGFELPEIVVKGFGDLFGGVGFGPDTTFRHYLGRLRGAPVACSTLFLGSDVAGIYNVATRPELRRQGIGRAITLAPLREARALGYRHAVLFATKMGFDVYRRLGFREYCSIGLYLLSDAQSV